MFYFDGISYKIDDDLPKATRVTNENFGNLCRNVNCQLLITHAPTAKIQRQNLPKRVPEDDLGE